MAVSARINNRVDILHTKALDFATYTAPIPRTFLKTFTTSDVDKVFHDTRSTTGETLDLTSGLTDAFGTALVFTNLKFLWIVNNHATSSITVGGGSNAVVTVQTVTAGGNLLLASTFTVDGTHKNLAVTPSTGTVSYDIILLGN